MVELPFLLFLAFAESSALPPLLDLQREVALAESAAPEAISKNANIFVLKRGGFVRHRTGSNGFTCFVARTVPAELEPICYQDVEGAHMLVDREFAEQKLREGGLTESQVNAEIGASYRRGELRPPQNFGLAYMLSPCNRIVKSDGKIGIEPPHLMFYAPYATNTQTGLDQLKRADRHSAPFILFEGEPWAFLIVHGEASNPAAAELCKDQK